MATINDRKAQFDTDSDDVADYYEAAVMTATDYFPFGAPMRQYQANGYLYGFNGKETEHDGEFAGTVHYDYGFRVYHPAVGRFLSVDPLAGKYAGWSSYHYALNNPILLIDPDGQSAEPTIDKKNKVVTINAQLNFYGSGATNERATEIAASIQDDWNAANGTIDINGEAYSVKFNVTGKKTSKFGATIGKFFGGAKNNYINLIEGESISETAMIAGNTGDWFWKEEGILNKEYSHEFGHLLGWYDKSQFKVSEYGSHDYVGYSSPSIPGGGNAPGIMTPSNALQTSKNSKSGFSSLYFREDHTLLRWTRVVTSADIKKIGINPHNPEASITTNNLRRHPGYLTPKGKQNLIQYIEEQSK